MQIFTEIVTFGSSLVQISNASTNPQPGIQTAEFPLAHSIYVEPLASNTHTMFVGVSTLAKSTGVGVISELAKPGQVSQQSPTSWSMTGSSNGNVIDLTQFFFDGTTGEKAKVTWTIL